MTNKKISDFTALTAPASGDFLEVETVAGNSRKVTVANMRARGALVTKAADQTAANYSTAAKVAFDAESYDTDSIHDNVTNNTRLTVPTGITKVRLSYNILLSSVTANSVLQAQILKNNSTAYIGNPATGDTSADTSPRWGAISPILTVVAGDYFELELATGADNSVTVVKDYTWFHMEIVA